MVFFKRKMYDRMLRWKQERDGNSALLIQGARRIGKSVLVEQFAKNEYETYLLIDFSVAPQEVHDLFKDISDLSHLFFRLQFIYHVNLIERKSVIIFDEVQNQPLARQAIKHLVKDHRYDYIETGSLITVRKTSKNILIPSEETKLTMYPMDYEEFRWAMGDTVTIPLLRQAFDHHMELGSAAHRKAMKDFRLYMIVGGMPQAVAAYLETNNLQKVDDVKREILSLYDEDFEKIDSSGMAKTLYETIPAQLSKNNARFRVSTAIEGQRAQRLEDIVKLMSDSMTTNVAYHSNDPNIDLALTRDLDRFKMYTSDTGLFITLAYRNKDYTENVIYEKLLNDKLSTNLGYVYENMIAQMLKANGKELFYHTMPTHEGKKHYEVDFLIAEDFKIAPIEVKSSGYKTHASLDAFCQKFSVRINNRYLIYTKDYKRDSNVTCLPVYMTMFL